MNNYFACLLNLKNLKALCAVFFWLSAYLAMFSLFTHLFSLVCAQVEVDPYSGFLAFFSSSVVLVFLVHRIFWSFWYGVRK